MCIQCMYMYVYVCVRMCVHVYVCVMNERMNDGWMDA